MITITSKVQLRVGDHVNVILISYESVRGDWNTDRFKPEFNNQQLGKPKKVVTETTGVGESRVQSLRTPIR